MFLVAFSAAALGQFFFNACVETWAFLAHLARADDANKFGYANACGPADWAASAMHRRPNVFDFCAQTLSRNPLEEKTRSKEPK